MVKKKKVRKRDTDSLFSRVQVKKEQVWLYYPHFRVSCLAPKPQKIIEGFSAPGADCVNMLTLFVFLGPACNWHWLGICVQKSLLLLLQRRLRACAHTWDSETNSPAGTSIPLYTRSIGLIGWPKIDTITVTDEKLRHGQTGYSPTGWAFRVFRLILTYRPTSCWYVRLCLVQYDKNI